VKELIMKARAFRIGPFSEDTKMAATCDSFGGGKIPLGQLAGWGRPADCSSAEIPSEHLIDLNGDYFQFAGLEKVFGAVIAQHGKRSSKPFPQLGRFFELGMCT
jgi:hypothetical protein